MKAHINGIELTVDQLGSGPAILFLHDGPDNRAMNDPLFKALADAGFRLLFTNLRGFGQRSATGLDELTRDAVALLNYLGIGRAMIFGIGRGGYVLLNLLEKHPGRIAGSSFVVPATMAAALRKLAGQDELKIAQQDGCFEQLKAALLAIDPEACEQSLNLADLPGLRSWIESVTTHHRRSNRACSALLAKMQPPPLLIEATTNQRSHRFSRLRAVNAKLLALFDLLTPKETEDFEEEDLAESR